jgi:hypothetical protein
MCSSTIQSKGKYAMKPLASGSMDGITWMAWGMEPAARWASPFGSQIPKKENPVEI